MARIELLILVILFLLLSKNNSTHVKVYHYTIDHWRVSVKGEQQCGSNFTCDWTHSSSMEELKYMYGNATLLRAANQSDSDKEIDVSVYNIHWLQEKNKETLSGCLRVTNNADCGGVRGIKDKKSRIIRNQFQTL